MADLTTTRVLLVEDELVLAEIVRESLTSRGFLVQHAVSVKDALLLYNTQPHDIMILDVMLPDGNGFSLAKHIRNVDIAIPIIF